MADNWDVTITGSNKVALKFEQFPESMRAALIRQIKSLTDTLARRIRLRAPHKTGKLQRSVYDKVFNDKNKVSGYVAVGEDFGKAAALEYGRPGRQRNRNWVSAHKARLDHVFAHKLNAPRTVMVERYRHPVHLLAARYLRDPLADMSGEIQAALQAAMDEVADKTNGES